jgi:predicted amidohydrolase
MTKLRVALLQMAAVRGDQQTALLKGDAFCRRARELRADIVLFPEMWNIGYADCPSDERSREAWKAQAVNEQSEFVRHFIFLAKELDMAIALTYLEQWPGKPRNSLLLIDRQGELALRYAKVHTCAFGWEANLTPGDEFHVAPLNTAAGEVKVGAMICFDREFPEAARILMLKGAEVILTPNACTLERNRLEQFRARAYENMLAVAMTNYAHPSENGHSVAYDGVAFGRDEQTLDMLAVEAGESEGVYLAEFDLERLRAYRAAEVWGNAWRKPARYLPLISPEVKPPFVRAPAVSEERHPVLPKTGWTARGRFIV